MTKRTSLPELDQILGVKYPVHHFRKEKIKERNKHRAYRYSSDPMERRIWEMYRDE